MLIPWDEIETVLLDMDGTLLDLHFDNYFWLEFLPDYYAKQNNLSYLQAKEKLFTLFAECSGKLTWYCLDHWTDKLDVPIIQLKQEVAHLIRWRENAELFLQRIVAMGKQVILVTNAHQKSLSLKMQKVNLSGYFDKMISSHDCGYPKENQRFWKLLQQQIAFNPQSTMFIDDSVNVLKSAQNYGIQYIYGIAQPDSKGALIKQSPFPLLSDYKECF